MRSRRATGPEAARRGPDRPLRQAALVWQIVGALVTAVPLPTLAQAAPTDCPEHFLRGQPPTLINPRLARSTRELCSSAFAVLHSGVTRTPLWAAERLTPGRIRAAEALPRKNAFHAEPRLPEDEQAELADYERSGYDRGHMAPSGDMPDAKADRESFSLANMVPQDPSLNRGLWAGIEEAVRDLAVRDGEVYVVTGPIFRGENLKALNGRVLVPTEVFKAVYVPGLGQAGAYVTANAADGGWREVSVARLREESGIDAFPFLLEAAKAQAMDLPDPTVRVRRGPAPVPKREEGCGWVRWLLSGLRC
jgi:endonuclease G, mitochondrial